MDDDYSGHRVINKTVRTACIPASYPSSPQKPIMDWDWRFGLKDLACGSEFSFARPSAATAVFPGANVKTVAANTPRFESNGMPLEGSATNLALWSNSFTAEHGHTLTDCTTAVSPSEYILTDGNDAPRYATVLTATANSGRVAINNISVTSGTKVNWSIFVKGISGKFRFAGYDGAQLVSAIFDPTTNSFSNISDPGGISSQLQYQTLPNNWFRLSITITPSVTSSTAAASIGLELAGNSGYISGSQFTVGPTLSSYIYTESATVTRASEGSDTSNNGLTMPLTQAMIDSLTGELLDGSSAWTHVSGTAPAYSGGNRVLTYSGALTSSDYHALSATISTDKQVEVVYTISGYAAGSVALGFGTAAGATRNANGTYTERGTLTTNTNFYVNATGFTGVINIISVRRVLDSGRTNPGEGTCLVAVELPWSTSSLTAGSTVGIITSDSNNVRLMSVRRFSGGALQAPHLGEGVNAIGLNTELSAGKYVLIGQWSSALGRMRIGLFSPTTGVLTWSSPTLAGATAYRGFFPITTTGGQRMRWFYGGGNLNISLTSTQWFNCILTDDDMLFYIKKFGCAL